MGLADTAIARHVIGCLLTQETKFQKNLGDLTGRHFGGIARHFIGCHSAHVTSLQNACR